MYFVVYVRRCVWGCRCYVRLRKSSGMNALRGYFFKGWPVQGFDTTAVFWYSLLDTVCVCQHHAMHGTHVMPSP